MENQQIPAIEIKEKKNNKIFLFIFIASIILNLVLIMRIINPDINITGSATLVDPKINQNLANNQDNSNFILHYQGLKDQIESEIDKHDADLKVGFFIQDLKSGTWTGKNERLGFAPASLLKVPIMIAILKKVERGEVSLDDKLTIRQEDIDAKYSTSFEGKENQEATVEELLRAMISQSDNTAKNVLVRQLIAYEIDDIFKHLGVPNPYLQDNKDKTVSPRDYSRFFKSSYYSTYLTPDLSEFALQLTTDTQLENLLPEGIPKDVQVAHKFGIYNEDELHDCGIVYHKKNPYIICVMTKELSSVESADLIRKISKNTYEFIDDQ